MENMTLFGIALGTLALALVKCFQDLLKFDEQIAKAVRAFLGAGIYLLIKNANEIQAAWPLFETVITQGGGALGVFLGLLGYWDDVQRIGYKVTGRALPFNLQ